MNDAPRSGPSSSDAPATSPFPSPLAPAPEAPPGPEASAASRGAPRDWYLARNEAARSEEATREAELRRLGTFRFLAFVGIVAPLLALETSPRTLWPVFFGVALVFAVSFVGLVFRYRGRRRARDRARIRGVVAREGLARLDRRWGDLPVPDLEPAPADHASAQDLDLLGRASLAHLLGTPRTLAGREALRRALLDPQGRADPSRGAGSPTTSGAVQRAERRGAAGTLARHPELLEAVQVAARTTDGAADARALAAFRAWARGPAWAEEGTRRRLLLAARLLTAVNLVLVAGWFSGWPPVWLPTVAVTTWLWLRVRGPAAPRFDAIEGASDSLGRWAGLLEVAARLPEGSPLLDRIREGSASPVAGAVALARLERISDWAQLRRSALVYYPVALLSAWDIHPLAPLERWRERHGDAVERWLEAVGELELLVALATLAFDHPDWVFPVEEAHDAEAPPGTPFPAEGRPGGRAPAGVRLAGAPPAPVLPALEARNLRHPLLPPERAVGNDVSLPGAVEGQGRLLLVTGSNMSGKSTLLRAIGVNQVLLLAGGPVAASAYRAPPLVPWTSMRIRDSLEEGVSLFMAELQRLRRVVDAARAGPALVLLDEILQGTNTAERRIAAQTILLHLVEAGAAGAVSTHDLTLADAEALAPHLDQVHLREEVSGPAGERRISFDHRLRPGPATSRNALVLLELVGLAPGEGGAHGGRASGPAPGAARPGT